MKVAANADTLSGSQTPRVEVVHALEQRVRLRSSALAGQRGACERIAEALAQEVGCEIVKIRPFTGSVIVERSDGRLDPERLRARLIELVEHERDDEGRPLTCAVETDAHPGPTRVARAVAHAFAAINTDVREALGQRADLGTLLPVIFASAGLAEVGVAGKLPGPAWFNLLWWSVRSFMTFNPGAVSEELQGRDAHPADRAEPNVGLLDDAIAVPGGR